jgi:CubicO group peptidase (beta-lactamase class C family)
MGVSTLFAELSQTAGHLGVLLLGTPWLVTAPGLLLALASYFRTIQIWEIASMTAAGPTAIHGYVAKDFEGVREAFTENFSRRKEPGAACCVYRQGEKVVDLWGGVRNKATGEPWEEDTMVLVYSATKGFAAMTLALAHSRVRYDECVCA